MPPMRVAEFMGLLQERMAALLPGELRVGMQPRIRFTWFQAHYHSPKVHYEVWLTRKTGRIEIGLHFEGPRDFSYRWLELMAGHMPEIMHGLGPEVDFEEWTPSWTRIHQPIPYAPLPPPPPPPHPRNHPHHPAPLPHPCPLEPHVPRHRPDGVRVHLLP